MKVILFTSCLVLMIIFLIDFSKVQAQLTINIGTIPNCRRDAARLRRLLPLQFPDCERFCYVKPESGKMINCMEFPNFLRIRKVCRCCQKETCKKAGGRNFQG